MLVLIVRGKPLKALRDAAEKAGGEVRDCAAPKPWELPKWAVERSRELGLQLDGEAAKELVARVGTEPAAALARAGEAARSRCIRPRTPERRTWSELTAGDDTPHRPTTSRTRSWPATCARRSPSPRSSSRTASAPGRLVFPVVRRLREVHRAVALLESGMPEQKVAGSLGRPPWLAKKTIARARKADRETLEHALEVFSELEVDLRGGGELQLDEDTAFSLALARATA